MTFGLEISGSETIEAAFRYTLQQASEAALRDAGQTMRRNVALQFLTEGRAYATPWLPRKARGNDLSYRPLLFRTGRLLGSLTDPDDPEHIEHVSDGELLFGTRVPYAAAHQRGTRHLPARPLLTPAMLGGKEVPTS